MDGYTPTRTWSLPISHLYIYMLYFLLRLAEMVRITAGINAFKLDFSSVRILTMYISYYLY